MVVYSENEFREVVKSGVTLVDFYADWCGPCQALAPVMEVLASTRTDSNIVKVNIDVLSTLASKYQVMSIPTVIVFKDGVEVSRTSGVNSIDSYNYFLDGAHSKNGN
jgi:thioredoxin 1